MTYKVMQSLVILAYVCLPTMAFSDVQDFDYFADRASHQKKSKPSMSRFLLITGCARSGTTYIAEALSAAGLDIGHELMGKDGCSSWFMCVGDDAAMEAPWKNRPTSRGIYFEHIFHQVRHPLKVISSVFATEHPKAIRFFSSNIPEINPQDSMLVRSAKYWVYWNLYAEKKAEWRYQVEQIDDVWEELGRRLGITLDKEVLKNISKTSNHRRSSVQLSWCDLSELLPSDLFHKIQEMAVRYGYSIVDAQL